MRQLEDIVARIAKRDPLRTEATLQADIRSFILGARLNIVEGQIRDVQMESQLGDGSKRRIDIEAGNTVIEVKRDLNSPSVLSGAEQQLAGYLHQRTEQTDNRYMGVLTDGRQWLLYIPDPAGNRVIRAGKPLIVSGTDDTERLRYWLGTVLATEQNLKPTGDALVRELGADSPAFAADHATLVALFNKGLNEGRLGKEIQLKHDLWAKLLRTALGSAFQDDTALFINHTLLVLIGELIAHAVLGLSIIPHNRGEAEALLSGQAFKDARISGVVESDFFDWPTEVEGGTEFIRSLALRLSRFNWTHPEHDVLKHLYEAIISRRTRASLGEYYTPDWLAQAMIEDTYTEPLSQRCADLSCGSGTFVFHAVRAYLNAAERAGLPVNEQLEGVTHHVFGMDVHPVAVTLARVTYLLALGTDRISAREGALRIPVFLGDSIQWEGRSDLLDDGGDIVTIQTEGDELVTGGGGTLFSDELRFPRDVVVNADLFDALLDDMAEKALDTTNALHRTLMDPILRRHGIRKEKYRELLTETFMTWRMLHKSGRNHIWSYYVRNLARPVWLTRPENRIDVLVGNPPWLRYSKMTEDMQGRYKEMARRYGLLSGPLGSSARELSTLFVARTLHLYGAANARFAFVMPHGTLTRKPHEGFRSGQWGPTMSVSFDQAWDLAEAKIAAGFPMTACVIRGAVSAMRSHPLPREVSLWEIRGVSSGASWEKVQRHLKRAGSQIVMLTNADQSVSPYKRRFRQGAIIVPRMLLFVEEQDAGPLGAGAGRVKVKSRRSSSEKQPWKDVPDLEGFIEKRFVHGVHLGETLAPYRMLEPLSAVLPIDRMNPDAIMNAGEIAGYSDLSRWWENVESTWDRYCAKHEKRSLRERMDHLGHLSAQLKGKSGDAVVYAKAGNVLTAGRLVERELYVVDHKLYWVSVRSVAEGRFLEGILNSSTLLERVRPLQTQGLFGPRDFDKHIFDAGIPVFDPSRDRHLALAELVARAEGVAADVEVAPGERFQNVRKRIRLALQKEGITRDIDGLVDAILP